MNFTKLTIERVKTGYTVKARHSELLTVDPLGFPRYSERTFMLNKSGWWSQATPNTNWDDFDELTEFLRGRGYGRVVKRGRDDVWLVAYNAYHGGGGFDPHAKGASDE